MDLHVIEKVDNVPEKEEEKKDSKDLMKPPISYCGPRDFKLKVSERTSDEKKEPAYLIISVLNDLHLVSDLMKAKIGKEQMDFRD